MRYLLLFAAIFPVLAQLIPNGSLGKIGSVPGDVNLYVASDQSTCSPIYFKQQGGPWQQAFSLGGSGALSCRGSELDVNPSVVPTLAAANKFTGRNTFAQIQLSAAPPVLPVCDQNTRGVAYFQNKGIAHDHIVVCASAGNGMRWNQIF
jgi:hypothetical protein